MVVMVRIGVDLSVRQLTLTSCISDPNSAL